MLELVCRKCGEEQATKELLRLHNCDKSNLGAMAEERETRKKRGSCEEEEEIEEPAAAAAPAGVPKETPSSPQQGGSNARRRPGPKSKTQVYIYPLGNYVWPQTLDRLCPGATQA